MKHDFNYLNTLDGIVDKLDYCVKYLERKIVLNTNKAEIEVLNAEKNLLFNAKIQLKVVLIGSKV